LQTIEAKFLQKQKEEIGKISYDRDLLAYPVFSKLQTAATNLQFFIK
jgi:hypothetical protein